MHSIFYGHYTKLFGVCQKRKTATRKLVSVSRPFTSSFSDSGRKIPTFIYRTPPVAVSDFTEYIHLFLKCFVSITFLPKFLWVIRGFRNSDKTPHMKIKHSFKSSFFLKKLRLTIRNSQSYENFKWIILTFVRSFSSVFCFHNPEDELNISRFYTLVQVSSDNINLNILSRTPWIPFISAALTFK